MDKQKATPINPPTRNLLAEAATSLKNRDFEQAIVQLKALLSSEPRHEVACGMLASAYAELGMLDRAQEYYERTLGINPANPLARFQLGLLRYNQGQWQEALATWETSLGDPTDYAAHFYSGLALVQLHKPAEAHALFAKAIANTPRDHTLYPELEKLLRTTE